jgi:hypothetical protein
MVVDVVMYTFIRLTTEKHMQQNANKVQKEGNKMMFELYKRHVKLLLPVTIINIARS